jgi:hypothetical protein
VSSKVGKLGEQLRQWIALLEEIYLSPLILIFASMAWRGRSITA